VYVVAVYTNPASGKPRWGVKHVPTGTLHFTQARGKTYAVRLMQKLKKEKLCSSLTALTTSCTSA
jgi:hypothetical protein